MKDRFFLSMETIDDNGEVIERTHRSFSAEDVNEVLDNFTYFLNGCSYTYVESLKAVKTSDTNQFTNESEQFSMDFSYDPDDLDFTFASA